MERVTIAAAVLTGVFFLLAVGIFMLGITDDDSGGPRIPTLTAATGDLGRGGRGTVLSGGLHAETTGHAATGPASPQLPNPPSNLENTVPLPSEDDYIPVPPMPEEEGLLGVITDARIQGEARDSFYMAIKANEITESTGRAVFSALRTTAGPQHRASFGLGQLVIKAHFAELRKLEPDELRQLGIDSRDLARMMQYGDAAIAWFEILVRGRRAPETLSDAGLNRDQANTVIQLASREHFDELVPNFGGIFAAKTGIAAEALADLARTRHLVTAAEAFRAQYQRDNGVAFDRNERQSARIAVTVNGLLRRDAVLRKLLEQMGGEQAEGSIAHYLSVGDSNENLYGWHARAVQAAIGRDAFVAMLERIDPITTRLRGLENYQHALAAVVGVTDLRGVERARMLARLGRCFHGAPGRSRTAFFFEGDYDRPMATTASQLEGAIQTYRLNRTWSDDRLQAAFDGMIAEIIAERSQM